MPVTGISFQSESSMVVFALYNCDATEAVSSVVQKFREVEGSR